MKQKAPLLDTLLGLVAVAGLIALYAPLVAVAALSFFQITRVRGVMGFAPFSLEPYAALIANGEILAALATSLIVAMVASLASLVLALMFAFYFVSARRRFGLMMQMMVFLPFLLPPIITGLSLLIAFREIDFARGLATIIVGHIVFIVPVVYRTVLVRLQLLGGSLTEASLDLGASRVQTLVHVILPQMRPALISGALLAFAISFDETLITLFVAGSETTLPIRLWAMMRVGFVPEINALATLILLVTALITLAIGLLQRGQAERAS
ncbi:ABC transporter permease [Ancylobacter amanitiformis]|uniref:Spermidine/putrescine transport system permease protein/spermidine/putrescine transport system permease protein n=1 Tax=Ancylobacter amanitiformis TaxID=217069 RepID=A0ABU0LT30_9HYPH|nr:ABC transporter permease [Ancylobacter amanitiformis]MDQ0511867.1 putative spermidine/putrescine transport system permease protein/spermidine/putrescine transport system permease protein [Ancylobacter amanitiformis]